MDEELRKKYDQFGEEGLKDDFHGGNQYQSWTFYRDNFGNIFYDFHKKAVYSITAFCHFHEYPSFFFLLKLFF